MLKRRKAKGISQSEVVIGFHDQDLEGILNDRYDLPAIQDHGLLFLLRADSVLTGSHQNILKDYGWNAAMAKTCGELFVKCAATFDKIEICKGNVRRSTFGRGTRSHLTLGLDWVWSRWSHCYATRLPPSLALAPAFTASASAPTTTTPAIKMPPRRKRDNDEDDESFTGSSKLRRDTSAITYSLRSTRQTPFKLTRPTVQTPDAPLPSTA